MHLKFVPISGHRDALRHRLLCQVIIPPFFCCRFRALIHLLFGLAQIELPVLQYKKRGGICIICAPCFSQHVVAGLGILFADPADAKAGVTARPIHLDHADQAILDRQQGRHPGNLIVGACQPPGSDGISPRLAFRVCRTGEIQVPCQVFRPIVKLEPCKGCCEVRILLTIGTLLVFSCNGQRLRRDCEIVGHIGDFVVGACKPGGSNAVFPCIALRCGRAADAQLPDQILRPIVKLEPRINHSEFRIRLCVRPLLRLRPNGERRGHDHQAIGHIGYVVVFALQSALQNDVAAHFFAGHALQFAPDVAGVYQLFRQCVGQFRVGVAINFALRVSGDAASRIHRHNSLVAGYILVRVDGLIRVNAVVRVRRIRRIGPGNRADDDISQVAPGVGVQYQVAEGQRYAAPHRQAVDNADAVYHGISRARHGLRLARKILRLIPHGHVGQVFGAIVGHYHGIGDGVARLCKGCIRGLGQLNAATILLRCWFRLLIRVYRHLHRLAGHLLVRVDGFVRVGPLVRVGRVGRVCTRHLCHGDVGQGLAGVGIQSSVGVGDGHALARGQAADGESPVSIVGVALADGGADLSSSVMTVFNGQVCQFHGAGIGHKNGVGRSVAHCQHILVHSLFYGNIGHRVDVGRLVAGIRGDGDRPLGDLQRSGPIVDSVVKGTIIVLRACQPAHRDLVAAHRRFCISGADKDRLALQVCRCVAGGQAIVDRFKGRHGVSVHLGVLTGADDKRTGADGQGARLIPQDVVAQHRVVGLGQPLIAHLIDAGVAAGVHLRQHKAALGRVDGQSVAGHQGRNAQVRPVAALRCGVDFRRLGVERRLLAVYRRKIAHKRADGPPVNGPAVFLRRDVVVALGVIDEPDFFCTGDGILRQFGIAVILHRAVRVQGLAGVRGGIDAPAAGLVDRHSVAGHHVADFDVADGRLGGAVVGFDVGRVGRVIQILAAQGQRPGIDFDGSRHIALCIHAGQIVLFQHRRAEGRGGGVGALVNALPHRFASLGICQDAAGKDLRFLHLAARRHGQHRLAGLAVIHLCRVRREGHGSGDFCIV